MKQFKMKQKEQKGGFLNILLGTLGARLLAGKRIKRAGYGSEEGKGIIRACYGSKLDF